MLTDKARHRRPRRVKLRGGPLIEAPADNTLLEMLDEVFIERRYTRHFDVRPGDTVVDIGANIGIFSLYAVRRGARVVAYEPFPANVDYVRRNAALNDATLDVRQLAVSDTDGSARLYITEISGGHLLFDHSIGGKLTEYVEVPTVAFDRLVAEFGPVDFLKLDCEGSEGAIVAGASERSLAQVARIAMEYHDNVSEPPSGGIAERLKAVGFTVRIEPNVGPFGYLYASR